MQRERCCAGLELTPSERLEFEREAEGVAVERDRTAHVRDTDHDVVDLAEHDAPPSKDDARGSNGLDAVSPFGKIRPCPGRHFRAVRRHANAAAPRLSTRDWTSAEGSGMDCTAALVPSE